MGLLFGSPPRWSLLLPLLLLFAATPRGQEQGKGSMEGWNCASGRCSASQSSSSSSPSSHSSPAWRDWHLSGSASVERRGVMLTADEPSVHGALWALQPIELAPPTSPRTGEWASESPSFDMELRFRVSGEGDVGADGFALWYTERGLEERFDPSMSAEFGAKHAFGHVDKWTGLGLFFDTYDNEDLEAGALGLESVKHPRILSIVNDGSFYWDHDAEGILDERRNGGSARAPPLPDSPLTQYEQEQEQQEQQQEEEEQEQELGGEGGSEENQGLEEGEGGRGGGQDDGGGGGGGEEAGGDDQDDEDDEDDEEEEDDDASRRQHSRQNARTRNRRRSRGMQQTLRDMQEKAKRKAKHDRCVQ